MDDTMAAALLWIGVIATLCIVAHRSNKEVKEEVEVKEKPKERVVYLKIYLEEEEGK